MCAAYEEHESDNPLAIEFWLFEDSHVKAYESALDGLEL